MTKWQEIKATWQSGNAIDAKRMYQELERPDVDVVIKEVINGSPADIGILVNLLP